MLRVRLADRADRRGLDAGRVSATWGARGRSPTRRSASSPCSSSSGPSPSAAPTSCRPAARRRPLGSPAPRSAMHAAAVLLVNNYRDRAHDATTGRRTLTVVLERRRRDPAVRDARARAVRARRRARGRGRSAWFALPVAALPWGWRLVRGLRAHSDGPAQNALLVRAVMLEVGVRNAVVRGRSAAKLDVTPPAPRGRAMPAAAVAWRL